MKLFKKPQENHFWILPSQFYQYNGEHSKYKHFKRQIDLTDVVQDKARSLEWANS